MKHEKFIVTGMTCSACSSRVEKTVSLLEGMEKASVNLLTNSMQVDYDETKLSSQDMLMPLSVPVTEPHPPTNNKLRMLLLHRPADLQQ